MGFYLSNFGLFDAFKFYCCLIACNKMIYNNFCYQQPLTILVNAKECSSYCTIAIISQASKVMCKILQARLQQYVNQELPDVQAGFKKGRGTRNQIANICWIIEKAREGQKTSASLTTLKPLTVSITANCGHSSRDGNSKPPYLLPEKSVCRSRSISQYQTWNHRLVPNWEGVHQGLFNLYAVK